MAPVPLPVPSPSEFATPGNLEKRQVTLWDLVEIANNTAIPDNYFVRGGRVPYISAGALARYPTPEWMAIALFAMTGLAILLFVFWVFYTPQTRSAMYIMIGRFQDGTKHSVNRHRIRKRTRLYNIARGTLQAINPVYWYNDYRKAQRREQQRERDRQAEELRQEQVEQEQRKIRENHERIMQRRAEIAAAKAELGI